MIDLSVQRKSWFCRQYCLMRISQIPPHPSAPPPQRWLARMIDGARWELWFLTCCCCHWHSITRLFRSYGSNNLPHMDIQWTLCVRFCGYWSYHLEILFLWQPALSPAKQFRNPCVDVFLLCMLWRIVTNLEESWFDFRFRNRGLLATFLFSSQDVSIFMKHHCWERTWNKAYIEIRQWSGRTTPVAWSDRCWSKMRPRLSLVCSLTWSSSGPYSATGLDIWQ